MEGAGGCSDGMEGVFALDQGVFGRLFSAALAGERAQVRSGENGVHTEWGWVECVHTYGVWVIYSVIRGDIREGYRVTQNDTKVDTGWRRMK